MFDVDVYLYIGFAIVSLHVFFILFLQT